MSVCLSVCLFVYLKSHASKFYPIFSDWVYPPTAYTGRFLRSVLSEGPGSHKLIKGFTQTNRVTTSFKATRPQKLSPLVTTGLLGVNRQYYVFWIHCYSTRSLISELAVLLLFVHVTCGCVSVLLRRQCDNYVLPVLWMTSRFHIMERMGSECFVEFARWRHRERSLPPPTASC